MGSKIDSLIVSALLIFGCYFPTSINENISLGLIWIHYLLCLALFFVVLLRYGARPSLPVCAILLSIVPILLVFSFVSGLYTYTPGALVGYAVLSVLFITNVKEIRFSQWPARLYTVVNILNIGIGVAILTGNGLVGKFLAGNYSIGYQELVPAMLDYRKPVLTFGTHSLAAFWLYMWFFANVQTYRATRKKWSLVFALCHWLLTLLLLSVSGVVLAAVGGIQLFYYFLLQSRRRWFWVGSLIVIAGVLVAFQGRALTNYWNDSVEGAKGILMDPRAGVSGRLAPGGTMYYDLQYLKAHAFSPVGISFRADFMFGDCGPVEYLLRGSAILLLLVYGGLFLFLRRNLISKSDAYFLFGASLAFELGYTWLPTARTLYLLPFFVIYFNGLRRPVICKQAPPGCEMRHGEHHGD